MIQEACKEKTERDRRRGIINRPVRAMVDGNPKRKENLHLSIALLAVPVPRLVTVQV